MSLNIESIAKLCEIPADSAGGITSLKITDVSNVDNFQIVGGAEVYTIEYSLFSAKYEEKGSSTRAGDRVDQIVSAFVPRKRTAMEKLRYQLSDRKVAVEVTDYNGDKHLIYNARLICDYTTNGRPSNPNGYDLRFEGAKVLRTFMPIFVDAAIGGSEGTTEGSNFGGGSEPSTGGTDPVAEACCVQIVRTPINYIPAPDSNVDHLNSFVTTVDGRKYYIDGQGISVYLGADRKHERIVSPTGANIFTLNNISLDGMDNPPARIIAERTQSFLEYKEETPANLDVNHWTIHEGQFAVSEHFPLEPGDYINLYAA